MKARSYFSFIFIYLCCHSIDAQVSGTVFRDFNGNGVKNNTATFNEPGVSGITVTAYDAGGSSLGSTTTASNGTYTIPAISGNVRIEFTGLVNSDYSGPSGSQNSSSVRFVTAPSSNIDFGVNYPGDYWDNANQSNPFFLIPCYADGDAVVGPNIADDAVVTFRNNDSGLSVVKGQVAIHSEVGAIWGVAFQRPLNRYFSSAFLKRHVGFGPRGPGGVYIFEPDGVDYDLAGSFDMQGVVPSNGGSALDFGSVTRVATGGNNDNYLGTGAASRDMDAYGKVGKIGYGDIDFSDDGRLFMINLFQRRMIVMNVAGTTATLDGASAGTLASLTQAYDLSSLPGMPTCTDGQMRPFALKFYKGKGYLGIVCDGEDIFNNSALAAYVLSFDPQNIAAGFTQEVHFNNFDYRSGGQNWRRWSNTWATTNTANVGTGLAAPQPMLCDIEFAENGDMIVGFMDRFGHQTGSANYEPESGSTTLINSLGFGDILHVCNTSSGWQIEGTGTCPVFHTNANNLTNDYSGSGEYYNDASGDVTPVNAGEGSNGALAKLMGTGLILSTVMTPWPGPPLQGDFTIYGSSGGVHWFNHSDGSWDNHIRVYENSNATFRKSHGLGDIEPNLAPAPIEIGNRVWADTDGDGIQDADEAPISGVTVQLLQGTTVIATATTDASGNYYFSSAAGTNTASAIYGITQLEPNMTYIVRIPNVQGGSKQTALGTNSLTLSNVGGSGQPDVRDSDGTLVGNNAEATVQTTDIAVAGANNHTFDFGFVSALSCPDPECGSISVNGTNYASGTKESFGFEVEDGYVFGASEVPAPNPGGAVAGHRWAVEYYNSGLFNSLSGYMQGLNTGQWTSPIGGADENTGYLTKHTYTAVGAYDRFGNDTGHFLGLSGSGNANNYVEYEYTMDANDFNGVLPSTLTDGDLKYNIWFCPSSNQSGANASTDNIFHEMKFYDQAGNMILSMGTGGVWNSGTTGLGASATSVWTQSGTQSSIQSHSASGNGVFANKDGWNQWQVTFHLNNGGPDSVSVVLVRAGQAAGPGILQSTMPPLTILDRAPLLGNANISYIPKMRIGNEGGGNKYYYEEGQNSFCPNYDVFEICDNGSENISLTAPTGLSNIVWFNTSGTQVGTGQTLSVNSNMQGLNDGSETFYYTATNTAGCVIELCCPVLITTKTCAGCNLAITCSPIPQSSCTPVNGSASTSVTGAQGSLSYLWSSGEVLGSISGKAAGTYTVTVTDDFLSGCTATCQAVITSTVTLPTAVCTPVANSNCATPNGSASVSTNAATPMYLWSNGSASSAITGLNAGTYTVTVTDTNTGCTNTCQAVVTNTTTPPTAMCTPVANTNCATPNGSASVTTNATNPTYVWSNTETTSSITVLNAGTYTVTVTDTSTGCTNTCQAVVTNTTTPPTAMCTPVANSNCATPNGSASVTTNATNPTFVWSNTETTSSITGLNAGTYTVTVTDTSTSCTNTCQAVVANNTVNPTCNVTIGNQPSCANLNGGSVTVTPSPSGTYSYTWSDGGPNIDVRSGLAGGTYTVTVTNTVSGCTGVCQTTLDTPMNCCNINAVAPSDIVCLDNGTPTIITDNRIRFNANITNTNVSLTGYNVTINGGTTITPNTNIPYGLTTFTLGTGTAGGGATFTITLTDSATPGCTQTFQIMDPGSCNNAIPCPTPKCGTAVIQVNGN